MASLGLLVLRGRAAALALTVLLLPLVVPYICLAVGLLILVQEVGAKPSLVAVVLGHCVIALPFAILVILPRLRSLDPAMNEAAQDLGASPLAALRLITLPLLAPALVSSGIICFVTSFDEFAIASFLAPSGQPTYPVFLYASARTPALLPEVIAIGALIIAGSLLLVVLAEGGRRWAERRLVGQTVSSAGRCAGRRGSRPTARQSPGAQFAHGRTVRRAASMANTGQRTVRARSASSR